MYKRMECANDIVTVLKSKGVRGELLDINSPTNKGMSANIYSDKLKKNISTNDRHRAVLVDGKVYDNINPSGIKYEDWKKDLNAPNGYTITKTSF